MNKRAIWAIPIIFGILLIACGSCSLLGFWFPILTFDWAIGWPIFLFLSGIILWSVYLTNNKVWGIVIPATILIIYSISFVINMVFTRYFDYGLIWATTIFVYPAGVAAGLWMAWRVTGGKRPGLLFASGVLGLITLLLAVIGGFVGLLSVPIFGGYAFPILLISCGLSLLLIPLIFMFFGKSVSAQFSKFMQANLQEVEEAEVVAETKKSKND